ncbi:MAG: radical SAM protein, partial [Deltaproteobacteria bacterium]|nr:radical SAM protein [Deltaproteobacteria bacterium]
MSSQELIKKTDVFRPKILNLMITSRCNYRCSFCEFHRKTEEMPFELAVKIIYEAQNAGIKTVAFTGGEPLLYAGIYDLVTLIKTLGMSPHITTNGALVADNYKRLIDSGLDSISFSVDGIGETHNRLRGVPDSFDKIEQGMKILHSVSKILLFVNMVVTKKNVSEIKSVYEFARKYNATFFFWPVNDIESLYLGEDDRILYEEAVNYICNKEKCSNNMYRFLIKGIDYHLKKITRFRCPAFFSTINIYYNGEVMPCCVWGAGELSAGNIRDK